MFIRYQIVFRAFRADTKSYRYGMNSNGTELEQVVHADIEHCGGTVGREGLVL